jgi:diacylglycerol kinase family enzyme
MNSEFMGEWDVAPRGHPNDGRFESFAVDPAMSVRLRLTARRRLRTGTHVPHPLITVRSARSATWSFSEPLEVLVDGRRAGRARTIAVAVEPDAGVVYA